MKTYEKNLKSILHHSSNAFQSYDLPLSEEDLIYLRAKGLITMLAYTDGGYRLQITDKGITYFDDKSQTTLASIRNWSMNIGIALLSACAGALLSRISLILCP